MTRKTWIVATVLVCLVAVADARPRPRQGKAFEANKTFGLGLEVGAPAGITGKYFLSSNRALQFGIGTIYRWRDRDGGHLYLDYLFHPTSLASNPTFELPLYFGIGGRLWDIDHTYRGTHYDDAFAIGLHVPVGIAFDFNNVPLDIFIQLAVCVDFYAGDYYRDAYVDVVGSAGVRYWFN
jgi:hypothetical protein